MDDTPYRQSFVRPTHPYHRRYEALRAVSLDGRSQKDVAAHFGYRYSTLRQSVYEFRRQAPVSGDDTPSFETRSAADRPRRAPRRRRG
jgi:transposase